MNVPFWMQTARFPCRDRAPHVTHRFYRTTWLGLKERVECPGVPTEARSLGVVDL